MQHIYSEPGPRMTCMSQKSIQFINTFIKELNVNMCCLKHINKGIHLTRSSGFISNRDSSSYKQLTKQEFIQYIYCWTSLIKHYLT